MNDDVKQRWSSRKFWAAMAWQAAMVGLLVAGILPAEPFVAITYLLLGGYFAGNVIQHIGQGRK